MRRLIHLVAAFPLAAMAQSWGNVGAAKEEVFTWSTWWSEPLFSGFWMAWTRATLAVFLFVFGCIAVLTLVELRRPGGNARSGILGLVTTRGDRLFIGLLGSVYIFLVWVGLVGTSLWAALVLATLWLVFALWKI